MYVFRVSFFLYTVKYPFFAWFYYLLTFGYFWWSFGGSHQAVSLKLSSWPVSGRSVDSV